MKISKIKFFTFLFIFAFFANIGVVNAQWGEIVDAVSGLFEDEKKVKENKIPCASQIENSSQYQVVSCSSCTLVNGKNGGMSGQCTQN